MHIEIESVGRNRRSVITGGSGTQVAAITGAACSSMYKINVPATDEMGLADIGRVSMGDYGGSVGLISKNAAA